VEAVHIQAPSPAECGNGEHAVDANVTFAHLLLVKIAHVHL